MKSSWVLIAFIAMAGCGGLEAEGVSNGQERTAAADPSSDVSVPPEIATAVTDWSACRIGKAAELATTPRSDEAVVDDALRECIAHEQATVRLWEKYYGLGSKYQVQNLRARWRADLIRTVANMRAGTSPTSDDPTRVWAACVGRNLPKTPQKRAAATAFIDAAFAACTADMQKAEASLVRQYGQAVATTQLEQIRLGLRKGAVQLLEAR